MPGYVGCAAAAVRLLLCQQVNGLVLDPFRLQHVGRTVYFDSIQNYMRTVGWRPGELPLALQDGCTVVLSRDPDSYLVLYQRVGSYTRRRFTAAHELGHIYLGHTADGPVQEREANWFAGQLLMPDCLLRELWRLQGHLLGEELESWFEVSRAAATTRLSQLQRYPPVRTGLDRQLLALYQPFLERALKEPLISIC